MAITIPGTGGSYTDLASDVSTFSGDTFRNLHRYSTPFGAKTERCSISGTSIKYKGHTLKLWGCNLTARCGLENIAVYITTIADELKARGHNLVRFHHIDQRSAQGGILSDSNDDDWWTLDATETGRLRDMIKELRRRGMWYTLDLNSYWGNGSEITRVIQGQNAADIFGSTFVSSTVNGAASSTTQTLASVGDLAAGMGLLFVTTGAFRRIVSVNGGANQVTLDSTISTTNGETVKIATDGFKLLPPINTASSNQLKAYTAALFALDVSIEGEAGVTIGSDPHLLYITLTNEHFPNYTLNSAQQRIFDAWYGAAWAHDNAAARTAYTAACVTYLSSFRTWMASQGYPAIPIAWGCQFGLNYPEYDALKAVVDINAQHVYRHEEGDVNESFNANEPHMQCASITDILRTRDPGMRILDKPVILEEWNACYPQRYRAEGLPLAAVWIAANGHTGCTYYDYGDGSYNPSTPPHSRVNQIQGDRVRDCSDHLAVSILRDLVPQAVWTSTNYAFEDRVAKSWGVDTERTIALIGHDTATKTFQRSQVITVGTGHRGVCFVTSVEPLPIWEAPRLLVGHLTNQVRRNCVFDDAWSVMTNAGSGASCIAHGVATITFYHKHPNNLTVYRLTHAGARGATITPSISGNLVTLSLAVDAGNETMLYEVVLSGTPAGR